MASRDFRAEGGRRARRARRRQRSTVLARSESRARWAAWIRFGALTIAAAGVLAYANSFRGPFVFDDTESIVQNRHIRHLASLQVLSPERENPLAGRPLANISFAVNYALGGLEPGGYHALNLAIHIACALLLFGIIRRTLDLPRLEGTFGSRSAPIAFSAVLVWLLHPLNTEVVNYLTQRTGALMAFFYLLTLYSHLRAHTSTRPARWRTASIAACISGMACKESMATSPVVIAIYDRAFVFDSWRAAIAARWRVYLGLAAGWLLLAALLWSGPRSHSSGFSAIDGVGPWTYLLNQTEIILRYFKLAVWPRGLVINYGSAQAVTLGDVLPSFVAVSALALAALATLLRRPTLGFLPAWVFITLSPTSSIVPINTEVGAERRMYLPLIGIVVLLVVGVITLWDRRVRAGGLLSARSARLAGAIALTGALLGLGWATVHRNREYRSPLSLALTVLERRPSGIAHYLVGTELGSAGRHKEAVEHLEQAVAEESRARYDLGVQLFDLRRFDAAIRELDRFVREHPQLLEAVPARILMGRAFAITRRWRQAVVQYRLALSMRPGDPEATGLLANALYAQRKFAEAIPLFRQYLGSRPNDGAAIGHLGVSLVAAGRTEEAIPMFRRAVELQRGNHAAERNLAASLVDTRRFKQALPHAERAAAQSPPNAGALDILGLALAGLGRLDDARAVLARALAIDGSDADIRDHLARVDLARQPRRPQAE